MSGGSLDYVYREVERAAEEIGKGAETPLQAAFGAHLRLVATALHDLEWVWSSDYCAGDEVKVISAVVSPTAPLEHVTERARAAMLDLHDALQTSAPARFPATE